MERRTRFERTQQDAGLVPDPAFHSDRLGHGVAAAEFQIAQVHLKREILRRIRRMQQLVYIQKHSTPRNDTDSIIA